jgi:protease-4
MKRKLIIFALLALVALLTAEPIDEPVGVIDDFRAPLVNPAALGYGTAGGFTYAQSYNDEDFTGDYSLFFNGDNLGYVFNSTDAADMHTLALGMELVKNLYLGGSNQWTNGDFKEGVWHGAALWRPVDYLSVGGVLMDAEDDLEYQVGLGLRPGFLPGDWAHRITLGADLYYLDDFQKPAFSIDTELLDGLVLGGRYNGETETFGVNLGVRFGAFATGTVAHANDDNKIEGGYAYATLADIPFASFTSAFEKPGLATFKLSGKILERKRDFNLGRLIFRSNDRTLQEVISQLNELKDNPKVTGIVIREMDPSCSFAAMMELKRAFDDFRAAGKEVIVYNNGFSNRGYMFAAAIADEIYLHPGGGVDLKGMAATVPYIGGLLDTLGIDVYNFRSHEYKTAMNMFSETDMTASEREAYETLLQDVYNEFTALIQAGRGDKLTKPVTTVIDEGPYYVAKDAMQAGLVDNLMHKDEFEAYVKESNGNREARSKLAKETQRRNWSDPATDKVAIVYAVGNFHMGKGRAGVDVGEESIAKAIKTAREDNSIKAIIIRIDSGGGSSMASEIIAREVKLCRTGTPSKPVIVSMGGTAASAGYHMSCYGTKIFAEPTTITGSIGVVGAFPNLNRLMQKIYVNWATVKMGENADFGSLYNVPSQADLDKVHHMIEESYWMFVGDVADGRGMDKEAVHNVAKGRVWTGNQALERGLIDELGGLQDAIDATREIAGLKHDIQLVEFTGNKAAMTITMNADGKLRSMIEPSLLPASLQQIEQLLKQLDQYRNEPVLRVIPWRLDME